MKYLLVLVLVYLLMGLRAGADTRRRNRWATLEMAGLTVSVWEPPQGDGPVPLVVFSHGFGGNRNQSTFLTAGLARGGYLVVAPNHRDASSLRKGLPGRPELPFRKARQWSDSTYQDRAHDIRSLLEALRSDPRFAARIDWSRVGLAGHSLGGYTVLGLAGAWPTWKLPGIRAVLALSPYCAPYVSHGGLAALGCPWSSLPEVVRKATEETEARWLELIGELPSIELLVRRTGLGEMPGSGQDMATSEPSETKLRVVLPSELMAGLPQLLVAERLQLVQKAPDPLAPSHRFA